MSRANTAATEYISLTEAAKLFPRRPSLPTINRWTNKGVRGVKLQTVKSGWRVVTTAEFVAQFLAELNTSDDAKLSLDGC